MTIQSFSDRDTEALWNGEAPAKFRGIEKAARVRLERLDMAISPQSLAQQQGNGFKKIMIKGKEFYEIRVNGKYRIFFQWDGGATKVHIGISDTPKT